LAAYASALEHQYEDLGQQHEAATLGMWVFLATEVLFFGVLFTGFSVYRFTYPASWETASEHLNWKIGFINTVVLLGSSLTMALAVRGVQVGRRQASFWCLILTALLGTTFMVFKAIEYYEDYREGLIPSVQFGFQPEEWHQSGVVPEQVKLFLMFYYIMTGLHAVHLTIGIVVVFVIACFDRKGRYSPEYYSPVEVTGLYWHFVDVVWIFLLPMLYLLGTHHW
jgi:cytochrome c oxidase subunit 3